MSTPSDEHAPLTRRDLQDRAIQGASWTMIHTVVAVPLGFGVNIILARALGASEYGRLAILSTLMSIVMGLVSSGPSAAVLQFGSKSHAAGRTGEVSHLLSISQGFELFVVAPALTVVVIVAAHVPPPFLVLALLFGVWVPAYLNQALLGLVIENKTSVNAKISMVSNLVSQTLVVLLALLLHSADAVWAGRLVISSLLAALALAPLSRSYRRALLRPRFPRGFPRGFWRFAIPTGAAAMLATLVTARTEVFVLEWLSTTAQVGIFALAFGLAGHLFAPAQALVGPLLPAISGLAEVDSTAVQDALHRVLRASSTLVSLMTALALPALTILVPTLYGAEYAESATLFFVLALAGTVVVVSTPISVFVQARLQGRQLLVANGLALAADVVIAVALIPPLGAWGAVVANMTGSLTLTAWLLRTELGTGSSSWLGAGRQVRPLAFGLVASLVALVAGKALPVSPWIAAVCTAAVGGAVLYALLRVFRAGLTSNDALALTRSVPARLRTPVAGLARGVTFNRA